MAHIFPRKNKDGKITSYTIRVFKGKDENGNNLKPYTTSFKPEKGWSEAKTQRELNKFVILFEEECKKGYIVENKQTFEMYSKYVLNLKEKNGLIKHKTILLYKSLLERINYAIGHIKITDLKPQHLNELYTMLGSEGTNLITAKPLSAKTILEHHRLIHTILEQAVKEMIIQYNVAEKATAPNYKRKEARHYEIEDIQNIVYYLEKEPLKWQVALNLLIYTGARRGEIAGIKINCIDFKKSCIHIKNNLLYSKEKGIYEDTLKTEASDRYVSIPEHVMKLVKKLVLENKKNLLKYGNKWEDTGYLLTQENGMPIHPDSITTYCTKFRKKYNKLIEEKNKMLQPKERIKEIPHLNPHSFRHSQATILYAENVDPVTISKRLGHARVSTTTDIYSHIMKKSDENASTKFDKALKKINS